MNKTQEFSRDSADMLQKVAAFTVRVDARRSYPVSGIVFDATHVLTLDHTVERDDDIRIMLPDQKVVGARVRGRDPRSNLVLLAVEATLGATGGPASAPARLGSLTWSVGRPDDQAEAVLGMVSAVGGPIRFHGGGSVESYLATDALRVPGFSGGPVVDPDGTVLGITMNSLREARSFAIGSAPAWKIAALLRDGGTIRRGYLGLRSQPTALDAAARGEIGREQESGLLVVGVETGAAGAEAGVLVGDIVVGFNGSPVRAHEDLVDLLGPDVVGKTAPLELVRGGKVMRVPIKPGAAS